MIVTQIVARTEILATHEWPDAPGHRKYLASPHAHVFKIEAKALISEDRGIEFHDLRKRLHSVIGEIVNFRLMEDGPPSFGTMSCERIGQKILELMPEVSFVIVSEDGQFDAEVFRCPAK